MKKPTGSSGLDDFTQKCQSMSQLFRKEEGDTFGEDSDEEDVLISPNESKTSDSDTDIEDFRRVSTRW